MYHEIEGIQIAYKNRRPEAKDYVLIYGNRMLSYNGRLPYVDEIKGSFIYGFQIEDSYYYLCLDSQEKPNESIDIARSLENRMDAYAILTGYHLYLWYKDHIYCPSCRKKLKQKEDERALECECGYLEYPRISPAVIVGVIHEDKILLTKYKVGYKNYALVAGFAEIGESFEDTVRREVKEEVGLKVKNIRYYKSQPWGMSGSILAGYYCEVDGDSTVHIDGVELGFGRFFSRDEIDLVEDHTTLTREMILYFKGMK